MPDLSPKERYPAQTHGDALPTRLAWSRRRRRARNATGPTAPSGQSRPRVPPPTLLHRPGRDLISLIYRSAPGGLASPSPPARAPQPPPFVSRQSAVPGAVAGGRAGRWVTVTARPGAEGIHPWAWVGDREAGARGAGGPGRPRPEFSWVDDGQGSPEVRVPLTLWDVPLAYSLRN